MISIFFTIWIGSIFFCLLVHFIKIFLHKTCSNKIDKSITKKEILYFISLKIIIIKNETQHRNNQTTIIVIMKNVKTVDKWAYKYNHPQWKSDCNLLHKNFKTVDGWNYRALFDWLPHYKVIVVLRCESSLYYEKEVIAGKKISKIKSTWKSINTRLTGELDVLK